MKTLAFSWSPKAPFEILKSVCIWQSRVVYSSKINSVDTILWNLFTLVFLCLLYSCCLCCLLPLAAAFLRADDTEAAGSRHQQSPLLSVIGSMQRPVGFLIDTSGSGLSLMSSSHMYEFHVDSPPRQVSISKTK